MSSRASKVRCDGNALLRECTQTCHRAHAQAHMQNSMEQWRQRSISEKAILWFVMSRKHLSLRRLCTNEREFDRASKAERNIRICVCVVWHIVHCSLSAISEHKSVYAPIFLCVCLCVRTLVHVHLHKQQNPGLLKKTVLHAPRMIDAGRILSFPSLTRTSTHDCTHRHDHPIDELLAGQHGLEASALSFML